MLIEKRTPTTFEYLNLRNSANWRDVDNKLAEEALNNSIFSAVAIDNDKVVGMGRVIGDGGLYFYIQDLIVLPDYQHKGIGKQLMKELMDYINDKANDGAFVGLMSAKGYEEFYKPFGFKARRPDAPGMFKIIQSS